MPCKLKVIHGYCKYHHDKRIIRIHKLLGTGDPDDNDEAEALINMYRDEKLISKILNYYPHEKPSETEENNEMRAIDTWKKKNDIFVETTMSSREAVDENLRLGKI